jgi:O-antigen/teichoic acid export membrane protein
MSFLAYLLKHKLFRNVSAYTGFNILGGAIPFLLLPVLTRYLEPSDYGIVSTFQVLLEALIVFVGMSAHGIVTVNYFMVEKDELKRFVGNVVFLQFISASIITVLMFLFKEPLARFIKYPVDWIVFVVPVALFNVWFTLALTFWRVEQRPIPYGITQVSWVLFNAALSLMLVIVFGMKWNGRILGIAISTCIFGIYGILMMVKRSYLAIVPQRRYISEVLSFCLPLIPASLGWWATNGIDRIFINLMVDVTATGVYTVGYQVGMIIGLLANSFNQAWSPFLFEKLKENRYATKIKIVKLTYLIFGAIVGGALILSYASPYFLKIFVGKSYQSAYVYVIWVALGYGFNGMRFLVLNYIYYVKKTYVLSWVPFLSAGINIGLNFLLIKAKGPLGAAQSTTISFAVAFILTWILSARVYPMPWLEVFSGKNGKKKGMV